MKLKARQLLKTKVLFAAWARILRGHTPLLSLKITRQCPLSCPGCYAYGDNHLGGEVTLRQLSDLCGDALVDGALDLVRKHRPVQVSFVGGEPLIRHRELSRMLPIVCKWGVKSLVVTSGVIPFPKAWNEIKGVRVALFGPLLLVGLLLEFKGNEH